MKTNENLKFIPNINLFVDLNSKLDDMKSSKNDGTRGIIGKVYNINGKKYLLYDKDKFVEVK